MNWEDLLNTTRKHGSIAKDDGRTAFRRDYDRVVYSTPFRRLQDKAQIYPLESHDGVRTRLTHSVEVSVTAAALSHRICQQLIERKLLERSSDPAKDVPSQIEDVARTCGIVHDFGNPPFGHAGEHAIRAWFENRKDLTDAMAEEEKADLLHFEGNAQTLRLLTRLQLLNVKGLNLTYGTLSASRKYIANSTHVDKHSSSERRAAYKKFGHFCSEQTIVDEINKAVSISNLRNPISIIVEAADDLVNALVDIEDTVRKGLVSWRYFHSFLNDRVVKKESTDLLSQIHKKIKEYSNLEPDKVAHQDQEYVQLFRIWGLSYCGDALAEAFINNYDDIMAGTFDGDLFEASAVGDIGKIIKDFLIENVYSSPEVVKLELMGKNVIDQLLTLFYEAISHKSESRELTKFHKKTFDLMSTNYKAVREEDLGFKHSPVYCNCKLATDYVCGMTDSFARNLHQRLFAV